MTTIAVIQARFGSSRLPGKVMMSLGDTTILGSTIDRVRRSAAIDNVVVATTDQASDDPIAQEAREHGAAVIRGSQFDVLDRFHDVLVEFPDADTVVRVTADCPFIDPGIIDEAVALLVASESDFVANRLPPPYGRTYPVGLDVEVCRAEALNQAWSNATASFEREHVMPYLYAEPGRFAVSLMNLDEDLSSYRWTVDTPQDLEVVRAIRGRLGEEPFSWRDILAVVDANPSLSAMNSTVTQKSLNDVDDRWAESADSNEHA